MTLISKFELHMFTRHVGYIWKSAFNVFNERVREIEREREREKNKYFMWIMFHAVSQNQHFMINSCEQSKTISEYNEILQP